MATADELRRLADQVEERDTLEEQYDAARTAYEANPDNEELKQEFQDAAEELRALRKNIRSSGVMLGPSEPGSVTVGIGAPVGTRRPEVPEEGVE